MDIDVVDDLKQPEYTGENRCVPCTILNLAIAAAVGWLVARRSKIAGVLAVGISIVLIYLRGYLVPGTPTLTKRYLPPEVLRWFGKEPHPDLAGGWGAAPRLAAYPDRAAHAPAATEDGTDALEAADELDAADADGKPAGDTADAPTPAGGNDESAAETDDREPAGDATDELVSDLETYVLEHDVLEPCEDVDDLCLTPGFDRAWFDAIEAVDPDALEPADAVDAFGFEADPDELDLESRGNALVLRANRRVVGRWPSRTALLADVAASRALAEWTPDWNDHDPQTKGQICNALRMFLEECPTGGDVRMTEEVVESCCTSHDVVAVICEESGDRLFEQRLDAVEA